MRASAGRVTGLPDPAQPRRRVRWRLPGNALSRVASGFAPWPAVRPRLTNSAGWRINARCLGHVDTAVLGCLAVEVRSDRAGTKAELSALVARQVAVQ